MITLRYLARRIAYMVVTIFIALTLNFLLPRLIPGNIALTILFDKYGSHLKPQDLKLIESQLDLHGSLLQQYQIYLVQVAHLNFGYSFYNYPEPVSSIIAQSLPWTIFLLGSATVISVLIGVFYGSYIGWKSGTRQESFLSTFAITLSSLPYFWLALLLQLFLAVVITVDGVHLFPVALAYSTSVTPGANLPFILSVLHHLALPLMTLVITTYPGYALLMRNTIVNVLGEDYMLMAMAKGLRVERIRKRYVTRNAILPVSTSVALSIGYIVGGAFIVEEIFSYPGIGYQLYQAVTNFDFPLIQGIFLIITLSVIFANFAVDLIYAFLDPRVTLK